MAIITFSSSRPEPWDEEAGPVPWGVWNGPVLPLFLCLAPIVCYHWTVNIGEPEACDWVELPGPVWWSRGNPRKKLNGEGEPHGRQDCLVQAPSAAACRASCQTRVLGEPL